MGVDGFVWMPFPTLFERDGTNCENLAGNARVRESASARVDESQLHRPHVAGRSQPMARGRASPISATATSAIWPSISRSCRACSWLCAWKTGFRLSTSWRSTPAIPDKCQWALFLRNHDELTLEMVTDDERDYMYLRLRAAIPACALNLGIRRRLAPLLDNNRRRIELLNSLLFSFPGTPVIYYGDEIGMGDNIYLGDRNGVRTPMQWNADRNAGFSRANPAQLYSPVIIDPVYGLRGGQRRGAAERLVFALTGCAI